MGVGLGSIPSLLEANKKIKTKQLVSCHGVAMYVIPNSSVLVHGTSNYIDAALPIDKRDT